MGSKQLGYWREIGYFGSESCVIQMHSIQRMCEHFMLLHVDIWDSVPAWDAHNLSYFFWLWFAVYKLVRQTTPSEVSANSSELHVSPGEEHRHNLQPEKQLHSSCSILNTYMQGHTILVNRPRMEIQFNSPSTPSLTYWFINQLRHTSTWLNAYQQNQTHPKKCTHEKLKFCLNLLCKEGSLT